ncbi:MAG: hypothetical protein H7326_10320 [Bdellovibrionaceae bacterium]|nr:hypothetical protein [Pseudobdellovibrionaceae bacterium]
MIRSIYQYFFYPLGFFLLQLLRPFLNSKTKQMVSDKNKSFFVVKQGSRAEIAKKRPFWIHAASGEIEYARPVIRDLKKRFPDIPVIVTYSSPSAKKILAGLEVDAWGALPWDFYGSCEHFLKIWRPRCFLIARTDVWPVMATACHDQNIPSLLFAATFASNSSRLSGVSGAVTAWALGKLSEIHCVSDADVEQLHRIKLDTPVSVHGDTRFDQVFHRLQNPKPLKLALKPSGEVPVLVAGSTWPEDERALIPAFIKLRGECQMILAPHEIQDFHLAAIERDLRSAGLTYCRYTRAHTWKDEDVLIADVVGVLAELYTWGNFAFVGGSFRKQVHSVMEPLAAGLPVIVGPFHTNNREALQFKDEKLLGVSIVTEVTAGESFERALNAHWRNNSSVFRSDLQTMLGLHRSSSRHVIEWCSRYAVTTL